MTNFLIQQDVPKRSKPENTRKGEKILYQHISGFAFLKNLLYTYNH